MTISGIQRLRNATTRDSASIWLRCVKWSGSPPDGELREKVGSDQPDMVRWIDTSCMVADCLTKRMRSDRLSLCLRSCWLDLIPTDESVHCKMKKQKGRTGPDGDTGDLDRNDHFGQWRSYTKELPLRNEISSIRHSDDERYGCENYCG